MPVSNALRRLLHVRDVEEEQQGMALEFVLGDLWALEHARTSAIAREHAGRELLAASVREGDATDRTAAMVEVKFAARCAASLTPRIAAAEIRVVHARQAYLAKRLERLQAQTLIEEGDALDAIESGRRSQQTLDDTFGARRYREEHGAGKRLIKSTPACNSRGPRTTPANLEPMQDEDSAAISELGSEFKS